MDNNEVTIRVENLWKRYGLPPSPALDLWHKFWKTDLRSTRDIWALQDVSFTVRRGEALGIIGRNGSGKSTLLKVLAGTTPPTHGEVDIRGRIFPMIELSAGMHMELTGRENVYLLGAIMGISHEIMETRIHDVEEFCDLGDWFDRPVRKYSSGMLARLGFSTAINVEADVLLVDEVLAVGDFAFQAKCFQKIEELKKSGVTILLVSHGLTNIRRICNEVLLLNNSKPFFFGDKEEAISRYYQLNYERMQMFQQQNIDKALSHQENSGELFYRRIFLLDENGAEVKNVGLEKPVSVQIELNVVKPARVAGINFVIQTTDLINVAWARYQFPTTNAEEVALLQPGEYTISLALESLPLMPGVYSIKSMVFTGVHRLAQVENGCYFTILNENDQFSLVREGAFLRLKGDWGITDHQQEL